MNELKISFFIFLATLFTLLYGLHGKAIECAEVLRELSIQSVLQNPNCSSCAKNLREALNNGPAIVTVMASWISPKLYSFQKIEELHMNATRNRIAIISDLSSQSSIVSPSNEPTLLTTVVFQGEKREMLNFFKTLEDQDSSLIHFEILEALRDQIKTDFASIYSRTADEREGILNQGLLGAQNKVIMLNDIVSKVFFAIVDAKTFQALIRTTKSDRKILKFDLKEFVSNWDNVLKKITSGDAFASLKTSSGLTAYVINLDDLSEIQTLRATLWTQLNQKLLPERPIKATPPAPKLVSASVSDLIARRAQTLALGGKAFGPNKPAILITKRNSPYLVAFYPLFLKRASEGEILATYKTMASLMPTDKVPPNIIRFVKKYKDGSASIDNYLNASLSDFTQERGFGLFEKSSKTGKPLVAKQLKSVGDKDEIILIPVPEK